MDRYRATSMASVLRLRLDKMLVVQGYNSHARVFNRRASSSNVAPAKRPGHLCKQ